MSPDLMNLQRTGISVKHADIVQRRFVIDFREREYLLILEDKKVIVCDPTGDRIGVIRSGSATTGGIWLSDSFVGEYRSDAPGEYQVVRVENGFKHTGAPVQIDPLIHLLALSTA